MFFFIVQVVTGVLLLMYYQPGEATAYESIRFLTTKVPFGWLIRSIHSWSAHLMIVSLVLHMFSTMMLKAYRPPREVTWVSGYFLFLLTLGFGFSGYLLPWNKLAYFATTVGTNIVQSGAVDRRMAHAGVARRPGRNHQHALPLLRGARGDPAARFRGGDRPAPDPHPTPGHGAADRGHAPRGMKFFPSFALRDLLLWLTCSDRAAHPRGVPALRPGHSGNGVGAGEKANPLAPAYPGIKPEWYFLWEYQLLKEFPLGAEETR